MQERFQAFTVLITRLNRCIRKIKTEEMAEYDLKSPHVSCLYYLFKSDFLTARQLCDICEEDKANISRAIDYLENNGFIVCCSDSEKRYKCPLTLTEKGRVTAKRISEKIDHILMNVGEHLSEENREIMYRSLSTVCEDLQKICDSYRN